MQEECFNIGQTYELCLRAFGELDVIHEEQIVDDKMNGYDILVMADVKMLPKEVADRVAAFVKRGGIVISDCVPQTDAYFNSLESMKELFGVKAAATDRVEQKGTWNPFSMLPAKWAFVKEAPAVPVKTYDQAQGKAYGQELNFRVVTPRNCVAADAKAEGSLKSGHPLLLTRKVGKGRCYLFGFCLQDTYFQTWMNNDVASRTELQQLVHNVFAATGVKSRAYSSNPDMEAGVRLHGNEAYCFVINHEAEEAITEVTLRDLGFEVGQIMDVEWGRAVDFIRTADGGIRFTVLAVEGTPTGVTRLLKITPKK